MPAERLDGGNWLHPARLPLGCGWSGHCTAPGHEGERPEAAELEGCNLGYASSCRRMPPEQPWDAVRFAVRASALPTKLGGDEGRVDSAPGRVIKIQYVCERGHRPAADGTLEFDAVSQRWLRAHADLRVQKMAECFLQVHLEKRNMLAPAACETLAGTA